MPAIEAPEAPGFTLASFERPGNPPEIAPKDQAALGTPDTPETPETPEVPEKPEPETPEKPDPETLERPTNEPTDTLESALRREPTRAADEAKAAADKKIADEAAAAEKLKNDAGKPSTDQRDADLKVEVGPHVQPKTRKIIEGYEGKTRAARDERDAAISRATELEKRALAAEEKAKSTPLPKETEDELKTLRERVRELDITQDPIIQQKYDARIKANDEGILGVLKAQGFGTSQKKDESGKVIETIPNPGAITALVKEGLTYETLQPMIEELRKAGLGGEARKIERLLEKNETLAEEKGAEISSWKGNHTARLQEREKATKETQDRQSQAFRQQTDTILKGDLEKLAKDFGYINRPAEPLPTDVPATAKAKQAAIAEYDAAAKAIETAVKGFDPAGVAPDKLPEVVGRINAAAIQSVVLKNHVLPRVLRDMAAQAERIKELEKENTAFKNAGRISRAHSSAPTTDAENNGQPAPKTLEQAFMQRRPAGEEG